MAIRSSEAEEKKAETCKMACYADNDNEDADDDNEDTDEDEDEGSAQPLSLKEAQKYIAEDADEDEDEGSAQSLSLAELKGEKELQQLLAITNPKRRLSLRM
jgi:hypothetical protein